MPSIGRRSFLRNTALGLAAGGSLASIGCGTLIETARKTPPDAEVTEDFWELVKSEFRLEPGLLYFNNASLGPSPIPVTEATNKFRAILDGFPSKYMWGGWNDEKEEVRRKAAALFGVSPEEIALIHNTTEGMNVIASSFDLQPGDEVILADHEHPSGTIPWKYWQETKGVRLVRPKMTLLPNDPGEIVDLYRSAITSKTKVVSMCHMINTNGMILPVREVCEIAHKQGIKVAVDGAQTAGMMDFNLSELGCDFYATSSHKWLFSPKGVGILYAKKESQHLLKPLVVAKGYDDTSIRRLENYNTRNLPEVLGLGAAIDFHNLIGTKRIFERILSLKHYFRQKIGGNSGLGVKTPKPDELSAGITTIEPLGKDAGEVKEQLYDRHVIDCRPMPMHDLNGLRISLSIFNTKRDIDTLVSALLE